jgi:hypothetical protein
MKKASITEAKNRLSAIIDGLKRGAPVLIVDRGRPVARLELMRFYPPEIRAWIDRHGGLTPQLITMRGRELAALYPPCH